jgi:hypothetical protein
MKNTFRLFVIIALCAVIAFSFAACGDGGDDGNGNGTFTPEPQIVIDETVKRLEPFADIRGGFGNFPTGRAFRESQYSVNDIITFEFNEWIILLGNRDIQARVMEKGKILVWVLGRSTARALPEKG